MTDVSGGEPLTVVDVYKRQLESSSTEHRVGDFTDVAPDVLAHPVLGRGFGTLNIEQPDQFRINDDEYIDEIWEVGAVGLLSLIHIFLGEWPQADVLDASGQRVGDARKRGHVRRACQQELPALVVRVQADLDREHQLRRPLDLVDHRGTGDRGDEAGRVLERRASRAFVVERQVGSRMLAACLLYTSRCV